MLTIRHLLTHTSGLTGDWYVESGTGDDALANAVARLGELEQVMPPGTRYSYCNPGYLLLGRIVEVVTGSPYHLAMRSLVLDPAGMRRSTFVATEVLTERFAAGHVVAGPSVDVVRPWTTQRMMAPAGGLIASVTELLAYGRHHLEDPSLARMREPLVPTGGTSDAVGLAWAIRDLGGTRLASHGGDLRGQASLLLLVPSRNVVFAAAANAQTGHSVTAAAQRAVIGALGLAADVPVPVDLDLAEYAGRYTASISDLLLEHDGDALVARTTVKPLVPGSLTRFPDPAVSRLRAYAPDRLIGIEGPLKDARAEVIRADDGRVAWLRLGGRVRRRVPDDGAARGMIGPVRSGACGSAPR
jgi:CubicO group peptidase (beta-lactamase class C family)